MTRTRVAIFLVSPDFFESKYIDENELQPLLEVARNEGLTIIRVLVRPCLYELTIIADYQAAHPPEMPLSLLNPNQQEEVLAKIGRIIAKTLSSPLSR